MTNREQALAALHRGDAQSAWMLFQREVQARPADPIAWEELGIALCCAQRPVDGLAAIDQAVALAPHQASFHYHRGYALELLGRPAEAQSAYRWARHLDPAHPPSAAAIARLEAPGRLPGVPSGPFHTTAMASSPPPYGGAYAPPPYYPPRSAEDSGRQVALIVGSIFLGLLVLVGGVWFSWWRFTQGLARLRPPVSAPSGPTALQPPAAAPTPPPTWPRPPRYRPVEPPGIEISPPPTIHLPEPPEIRVPDPPEIRIPRIEVPEPPRFEPPRFERPRFERPGFGQPPFRPHPFPDAPGFGPEPSPGGPGSRFGPRFPRVPRPSLPGLPSEPRESGPENPAPPADPPPQVL